MESQQATLLAAEQGGRFSAEADMSIRTDYEGKLADLQAQLRQAQVGEQS